MDISEEQRHHLLRHGPNKEEKRPKASTWPPSQRCVLVFLAVMDLFLVFALVFVIINGSEKCICNNHSAYAKLDTNIADTLWWNTEYSSDNDTLVDELWINEIPWESGIIALTKAEAQLLHLPESQPFPWDPKEKSIYIVNAHHILHCVRNLYISIREYRKNQPQSVAYPHIVHCLDSIRQETMCAADDTPRYVPVNGVHGYRPGDGQDRQCRDWHQLEEFVQQHDPCYRYVCPGNEAVSNLERFKYCPNDSVYLPKIRKYFGFEKDWVPSLYEEPDMCTAKSV